MFNRVREFAHPSGVTLVLHSSRLTGRLKCAQIIRNGVTLCAPSDVIDAGMDRVLSWIGLNTPPTLER